MGSGALDSSQWLSVKEETIFLHDGLMRVTDLAELPSELGVSEQGDTEQEVSVSLCFLTLVIKAMTLIMLRYIHADGSGRPV